VAVFDGEPELLGEVGCADQVGIGCERDELFTAVPCEDVRRAHRFAHAARDQGRPGSVATREPAGGVASIVDQISIWLDPTGSRYAPRSALESGGRGGHRAAQGVSGRESVKPSSRKLNLRESPLRPCGPSDILRLRFQGVSAVFAERYGAVEIDAVPGPGPGFAGYCPLAP